jgi:hypothetical protein
MAQVSISLRHVLYSFRDIYFQPPPFSRNHALWEKFSVHLSAINTDTNIRFFRYLCVNAVTYNLGSSISPAMEDPCLFCVLDEIKEDCGSKQFAFIALFNSSLLDQHEELNLELFVFRVDQLNRFPYTQPHSVLSFHSTVSHDNLQEHCSNWNTESWFLKKEVAPKVLEKLT